MGEITITLKIDGNAVAVSQDAAPRVQLIHTQPQILAAPGRGVVVKRRLARAYNDQQGGEGPDTTP